MKLILDSHLICINENEKASFVHGFISYNMKVKYRLSTDYDTKKEIFLKTYNGGILIKKKRLNAKCYLMFGQIKI